MDYLYQGGTLANGGRWTGSVSKTYAFDTHSLSGTSVSGSALGTVPAAGSTCNDSAWTRTIGASTRMSSQAYGKDFTSPVNWRNQVRIGISSSYTAPNRLEIHAIGTQEWPGAGLNVGARCNNLFVNLGAPNVVVSFMHDETSVASGTFHLRANWSKALAGLRLIHQCAWSNTGNNRFSLTTANRHMLPPFNPDDIAVFRTSGASSSPTATSASFSSSVFNLPLLYYQAR